MGNNSSTVAKNTIVLYFRMIISLCVSLYTSRVILQSLGVIDYGVYNVVGGIVACMAFMLQSLVVSFQRFFFKYIPSNDNEMLSKILGSAILLIVMISVIVLVLVETVGIWFLNTKLSIPEERLFAANIVLQFSIVVFIVSLFQAIYNSVIISYERMNVYAYISIFDVVAKLAVAWIISIVTFDRLITYSFLLALVACFSFLFYFTYVTRTYKELRPVVSIGENRETIKELFKFLGMSMVGTISHVAKSTGIGFLLNIFFGPALNAARAISFQIYTAVSSFTQSFQTAFSPNMMKQYEVGSSEEIEKTLYAVSKFSFFAMFLLAYPIIMAIDPILNIWLGAENVPAYTNLFSVIILSIGLVETLANPVVNVVYAKGNINGFMASLSIVVFLSLPVAYVLLAVGYSPVIVYIVDFIAIASAQIIRIIFLNRLFSYKYISYFTQVFLPILFVLVIALICWSMTLILPVLQSIVILYAIISEILVGIAIFYLGLKPSERNFVIEIIKAYASRCHKRG